MNGTLVFRGVLLSAIVFCSPVVAKAQNYINTFTFQINFGELQIEFSEYQDRLINPTVHLWYSRYLPNCNAGAIAPFVDYPDAYYDARCPETLGTNPNALKADYLIRNPLTQEYMLAGTRVRCALPNASFVFQVFADMSPIGGGEWIGVNTYYGNNRCPLP